MLVAAGLVGAAGQVWSAWLGGLDGRTVSYGPLWPEVFRPGRRCPVPGAPGPVQTKRADPVQPKRAGSARPGRFSGPGGGCRPVVSRSAGAGPDGNPPAWCRPSAGSPVRRWAGMPPRSRAPRRHRTCPPPLAPLEQVATCVNDAGQGGSLPPARRRAGIPAWGNAGDCRCPDRIGYRHLTGERCGGGPGNEGPQRVDQDGLQGV